MKIANLSRRDWMKSLALVGTTSVLAYRSWIPAAQAAEEIKDDDVFQFALNLEYMEAEYYLRHNGQRPGSVRHRE